MRIVIILSIIHKGICILKRYRVNFRNESINTKINHFTMCTYVELKLSMLMEFFGDFAILTNFKMALGQKLDLKHKKGTIRRECVTKKIQLNSGTIKTESISQR